MTQSFRLLAGLLAGAIGCGGAGLAQDQEGGRTFFVNAASGNDSQDGLSAQSPWRSLTKVNAAELQAGDKVLFHRGNTWRGTLVPRSGREGKPITYGAYGEGDKPLLLGSVSRNEPGDWHEEGDIRAGRGIALLDPHGDLAEAILDSIPSHRANDVVLFDAGDRAHPLAFNALSCGEADQRGLVASAVVSALKKLYGDSRGPRLEHILRNAPSALLILQR